MSEQQVSRQCVAGHVDLTVGNTAHVMTLLKRCVGAVSP